MLHQAGIGALKITLGKTEEINGIEQVGFPYPVPSANGYKAIPERPLGRSIVFKLVN